MMRALAVAVLLAGCAKGASEGNAPDSGGNPPQTDAPVADARVGRDAITFVDAPPHADAPPADASIPIDAPRPIDAPPPKPDAPPPPDACVPISTQLLLNPTFDLTPAGTDWTQDQPAGFAMIGAFVNPEQSAPFNVYIGGELNFGVVTDIVTQNITIPAETTKLELTGFWAVDVQGDPFNDSADLALIQSNGTPVEDVQRLSENTTPTDQWVPIDHVFANPAALSGQTLTLRMTSTDDGDDEDDFGDIDQTNFFFDTFALTATHGCP